MVSQTAWFRKRIIFYLVNILIRHGFRMGKNLRNTKLKSGSLLNDTGLKIILDTEAYVVKNNQKLKNKKKQSARFPSQRGSKQRYSSEITVVKQS